MIDKHRCTEIKQHINGNRDVFQCRLIRLDPQPAILKYVIEKEYLIDDLRLKPGMITYGFYWENQPYTLYKWFNEKNQHLADYFNIADSVRINREVIFWRDLAVDLIVYPAGRFKWLDLNELDNILDNEIRKKISSARQLLLSVYWRVIQQTNLFVKEL